MAILELRGSYQRDTKFDLLPDEIQPAPEGKSSDIATLWVGGDGYWYCPPCEKWHRASEPDMLAEGVE